MALICVGYISQQLTKDYRTWAYIAPTKMLISTLKPGYMRILINFLRISRGLVSDNHSNFFNSSHFQLDPINRTLTSAQQNPYRGFSVSSDDRKN